MLFRSTVVGPACISSEAVATMAEINCNRSMAHIIPSDISQLALAGAREPELDTLRVLKTGLPAAFTVFHGVHWSRSYKGGTCYGEIDFVVINQAGDVLLIEQKKIGRAHV